jgi:pimeloyl-ACP methyl ester carboxylesterase
MLHYKAIETSKQNEWIVFIHGAGGSSSIFYRQVKAFRKEFNLLLIDLHGHGKSKGKMEMESYTYEQVARDVLAVLDHLKISSAHFVGVSLGTIVIHAIYEFAPEKVASMIMGGAVLKFNFRSRFLLALGNACKYFIPYMWLYKLFAWILMPKSNHSHSRNIFVKEAKVLGHREFIKWFRTSDQVERMYERFRRIIVHVPQLYIMGREDHMFLPIIKKTIQASASTIVHIIDNCGHVCNIDRSDEFNEITLSFLRNLRAVQSREFS